MSLSSVVRMMLGSRPFEPGGLFVTGMDITARTRRVRFFHDDVSGWVPSLRGKSSIGLLSGQELHSQDYLSRRAFCQEQ
jgi:hypothetical protein